MKDATVLYNLLVNDKSEKWELERQWHWLHELKIQAPELYNKYMKSIYPKWEDVK